MKFKQKGFPMHSTASALKAKVEKTESTQEDDPEYQKNWPKGGTTDLETQLSSFKADLADAEAWGDTEMIKKIKQDIASTEKEIGSKQ